VVPDRPFWSDHPTVQGLPFTRKSVGGVVVPDPEELKPTLTEPPTGTLAFHPTFVADAA
jgi:hypothetical protein